MQFPAPAAPVHACLAYYGYGNDPPESPLVISVPHAGRHYPAWVMDHARIGQDVLERLEDRFADLLVHTCIGAGHSVFVARQARAVIDLNRAETEIDAGMVVHAPSPLPLLPSAKVRGGLGLIPRRLSAIGDLWKKPLEWNEVQRRVAEYHRPYHLALEQRLATVRRRFGHAILLDIHSMPPLSAGDGTPPRIVVGDRFGRSAGSRLSCLAVDIATAHGLKAAQNHPYPGSYLLDRHGSPSRNVHAIQLEIDRSLYLDASLRWPAANLAKVQKIVLDLAEGLASVLSLGECAQAAE